MYFLTKTIKLITKSALINLRKSSSSSVINKISFKSPQFLNYLRNLETEYQTLNSESKLTKLKVQRLQYLKPIIEILIKHQQILNNIESLKDLTKDANEDLKKLITEENQLYNNEITNLENVLKSALLTEVENESNVILFEITAGVGGQEAMLFARNLYEMYINYIHFKNWDYKLAQLDSSEIGGVRHASMLIEGDDVYPHLSVEAGVHRVQRVPSTERSGRIHTSTVTITAIPQPDDIEIDLKPSDLRIETKRAGGAGGQHVNTTDSAVRIVHLPTNIAVDCQTERSQIKNKDIAMQKLRMKLYENICSKQLAEGNATRKSQVASSLRSEKIRTYNFSQHRISDHRLQENLFNLSGFLEGNDVLDELITKLREDRRVKFLVESMQQYETNSNRK